MKIRQRERRGHVKEAGGYTSWTEWQIVHERRVIARYETENQAKMALAIMKGGDGREPHPGAEVVIFPGIPKVKP